jgi:hypothetical protein
VPRLALISSPSAKTSKGFFAIYVIYVALTLASRDSNNFEGRQDQEAALSVHRTEVLSVTRPEAKDPLGAAITAFFKPVVARCEFKRWGGRGFARIRDSLVQYMGFQSTAYGTKDFCVNYCTVPLFLPHDFFGWTFGGRFPRGKSNDGWWKSKKQAFADESMKEVANTFVSRILPWFDETATVQGFLREVEAARPSPNVHVEFNYACCLAWLSRDQEAKGSFVAARAGYEASHLEMPERDWAARHVSHCEELMRAIETGNGRSLLTDWRDVSITRLKLTRIAGD